MGVQARTKLLLVDQRISPGIRASICSLSKLCVTNTGELQLIKGRHPKLELGTSLVLWLHQAVTLSSKVKVLGHG